MSTGDQDRSDPRPALAGIPFWLLFFAGLIAVSLLLEDRFYPFSHFPMYSVNKPEDFYFYLTDKDGNPVPVKRHFKPTASHLKKYYKTELQGIAKERGVHHRKLKDSDRRVAAKRVLERVRAMPYDNPDPERGDPARFEPMRLVRVDLKLEGGGLKKSESVVAP